MKLKKLAIIGLCSTVFLLSVQPMLLSADGINQDARYEHLSIDERNQAILDKLADEYNLDELGIHAEIRPADLTSSARKSEKSAPQYEKEWREVLEMAIAQHEEVVAFYETQGIKYEDIEWIECGTTLASDGKASGSKASKTVTQEKDLGNLSGMGYLKSTITKTEDGTNVVRYLSVQNAYGEGLSIFGFGFKIQSYSYRFLDNSRTCAVTYTGYLYVDNGVVDWVKTAEFYASSAW